MDCGSDDRLLTQTVSEFFQIWDEKKGAAESRAHKYLFVNTIIVVVLKCSY